MLFETIRYSSRPHYCDVRCTLAVVDLMFDAALTERLHVDRLGILFDMATRVSTTYHFLFLFAFISMHQSHSPLAM